MALDPKTLSTIIKAHVKRAEEEHEDWDRHRAFYRCERWGGTNPDSEELFVENGHLFGFVDTMTASVVPPTPRVTVNPRQSDEKVRLAAKYREALLNYSFYEGKLHQTLWKMATNASVYPRSVVKTVWNQQKQRPEYLSLDPRNFFFDLTANRWEDIRYAVEVTVLTAAEFQSRVKRGKNKKQYDRMYNREVAKLAAFANYPSWLQSKRNTNTTANKQIREVFKWVTVYEVWDFTTDTYYHMLDTEETPLYEGDLPYVFTRNPFSLLTFNDNIENIGGLSDSQLIENPLGRLDELDTLELRFAQSTIPVTTLNEAFVEDPERAADDLQNKTSPGDVWRIQGKDMASIADIVGQTPTSQLSPNFAQVRSKISEDILFRLGMPQYMRGGAGAADLATELALINQALQTRQGRRIKMLEDVIQSIAQNTIGLFEEFLAAGDILPIRLGREEFLEVSRNHLRVRDPDIAEAAMKKNVPIEAPLAVDYEVIPFNPSANSKSAQLARVVQFLELLVNNPMIDQQKLMVKLLELLELGDEMLATPEQVQAASQAAQGPPPAKGGTPQNTDNVEGGGLPPGVAEPAAATPAMGAMAGGEGHPAPLPTAM
jgi:hypothetical protein